MTPALLIKSTQPGGHFRAGRYHGPEETAWDASGFSPEEVEALRADPRLIVVEGELDVPALARPVPKLAATPTQECLASDVRVTPPLPEPGQTSTATAAAPEGETPPAPAQPAPKAKAPVKSGGKKAKA